MSHFELYDDENSLLMIPGPVFLHPKVQRVLSRPIFGHRTNHFRGILAECEEMLKGVFGTNGTVFMLTGSGTSAMDAAVRTFISPKEKVVSFIGGKFGERFADIAQSAGANVIRVNVEWGKAIKPDLVKKVLEEHPDAKAVTITHNETSTGVLHPLPEIAKVVKKHDAYLIVDGITSVGGDYVKMDEWGVDVMVSGSQKCLGIPPGLGFVAISTELESVLEKMEKKNSYYLDLKTYYKYWKKKGDLPFTGSVTLFYALYESLKMIFAEGLEARIQRHRKMARAMRKGFTDLGFELFAEKGYESNTLTAVKYLPGMSDNEFRTRMQKHGVLIAGGQAHLAGKIFRVAHMSMTGEREVLTVLAVAELVMHEMGVKPKGSGVKGAISEILRG